jgi:hypothetical protein
LRNQNSSVILLNVENLSPKLFDLKQTARGNQSFIKQFVKHGAKHFAKEDAGTLLQFLARQLTS